MTIKQWKLDYGKYGWGLRILIKRVRHNPTRANVRELNRALKGLECALHTKRS